MTKTLTQERLKELLSYDPCTGKFVWLIDRGRNHIKGHEVGCLNTIGYRCTSVDSRQYKVHRLAFLYMTGEMPQMCDHANGVRDDNRWANLRAATPAENSRNKRLSKNNKTGYIGVRLREDGIKFRAQIHVGDNCISLGTFTCKHHAFCEYVLASRKYFGEFSAV